MLIFRKILAFLLNLYIYTHAYAHMHARTHA